MCLRRSGCALGGSIGVGRKVRWKGSKVDTSDKFVMIGIVVIHMTSEDGTHSGFQNISKFALYIVQKPKKQYLVYSESLRSRLELDTFKIRWGCAYIKELCLSHTKVNVQSVCYSLWTTLKKLSFFVYCLSVYVCVDMQVSVLVLHCS